MRKRRAFADRDLDAVMYQREQQLQLAAINYQRSASALPAVVDNENDDSDIEIDVISTSPPSPVAKRSSKISFSVESIIGRPC